MKLSLIRSIHPPSEQIPEAEVDVTPVMNMFIILIPFLVSMAVFTQLSIVEISLPPNIGSQTSDSETKPQPKLTVRIGNDYVGIVIGEKLLDSLPVVNGIFPMDTLGERLKLRRNELSYNEQVIIASMDAIPFRRVVEAMDLCRAAGLEKIGLSSATEEQ